MNLLQISATAVNIFIIIARAAYAYKYFIIRLWLSAIIKSSQGFALAKKLYWPLDNLPIAGYQQYRNGLDAFYNSTEFPIIITVRIDGDADLALAFCFKGITRRTLLGRSASHFVFYYVNWPPCLPMPTAAPSAPIDDPLLQFATGNLAQNLAQNLAYKPALHRLFDMRYALTLDQEGTIIHNIATMHHVAYPELLEKLCA